MKQQVLLYLVIIMYQYLIDLPNLESIVTGHYSFYTTTSLTLSSRIKVYHFHE